MTRLVLGSGSTIRRRMLANAGFHFEVIPARVDEVLPQDAAPEDLASALALVKAHEVLARHPDALVIGSDQLLVLPDGGLAGKTDTLDDARARIRELSGRTHGLVSAAAIVSRDVEIVVADRADITFRMLGDDEIEHYLDMNEWRGSAGSYLVESRGVHLIERVDGDFFTVLGMPLLDVVRELRALGRE